MSLIQLEIATNEQFNFRATVLSHGWRMLAPFSWDDERGSLDYIYQTAGGDLLRLQMSATESAVLVALPDCRQLTRALENEVADIVKRMLNTEWDLGDFYTAMRARDGYQWLEVERRGRILICPSLWEDLAKVLLTTNCNWSQTVNMTRQLCQLGEPHPSLPQCHAFPSPERIAALPFEGFAHAVRAGYRSAYLHQLAQRIASGEIDLASWHGLDSDSLFQAVKSLHGFGDYAAGTMLRMLGHFDKLAIDSACHTMYAEKHNGGVRGSVKDIQAHYARFGKWRGLVQWMDIMRHFAG